MNGAQPAEPAPASVRPQRGWSGPPPSGQASWYGHWRLPLTSAAGKPTVRRPHTGSPPPRMHPAFATREPSMNVTPNASSIAQAKDQLKRAFPKRNIVYSDAGRWEGFRDPTLHKTDPDGQLTGVDVETAERPHEELAAAEARQMKLTAAES